MNSYRTVFEGFSVDLSPSDTWAALFDAEVREGKKGDQFGIQAEVFYRGEWWVLGRTDLKDDVCTGKFVEFGDCSYSPNQMRRNAIYRHKREFMGRIHYGARLKRHSDGRRTFAVVDSYSDG